MEGNPTQNGLNSGMGLPLDMGVGPPIKGKGLNSGYLSVSAGAGGGQDKQRRSALIQVKDL